MSLAELLTDMEENLPNWIRDIAEVWGTPRYAILRVYRGLIDDPEPGWQHLKPSAIPSADSDMLCERTQELTDFEMYRETAEEVAEGNDYGLAIAILKTATEKFANLPEAWTEYANLLTQTSRTVSSVLEKGDFFYEAKNAINTALELEPDYASAHLLQGYNHILSAFRNGDDPAQGMESIYKALVSGIKGTELAQAYFSIGLAHRTNSNETLAREAFAQAIEVDPSYMPAQFANMV